MLQDDCWTYRTQLGAAELLWHKLGGFRATNEKAEWLDSTIPRSIGYILQQTRGPKHLLRQIDDKYLEAGVKWLYMRYAHEAEPICWPTHCNRHAVATIILESWEDPGTQWKVGPSKFASVGMLNTDIAVISQMTICSLLMQSVPPKL